MRYTFNAYRLVLWAALMGQASFAQYQAFDHEQPAQEDPSRLDNNCDPAVLQQASALMYLSPEKWPFTDGELYQDKSGVALKQARSGDYQSFVQEHLKQVMQDASPTVLNNFKVRSIRKVRSLKQMDVEWKDARTMAVHRVRFSLSFSNDSGDFFNKATGKRENGDVVKVENLQPGRRHSPCKGNAYWYLDKGRRIQELTSIARKVLHAKEKDRQAAAWKKPDEIEFPDKKDFLPNNGASKRGMSALPPAQPPTSVGK